MNIIPARPHSGLINRLVSNPWQLKKTIDRIILEMDEWHNSVSSQIYENPYMFQECLLTVNCNMYSVETTPRWKAVRVTNPFSSVSGNVLRKPIGSHQYNDV